MKIISANYLKVIQFRVRYSTGRPLKWNLVNKLVNYLTNWWLNYLTLDGVNFQILECKLFNRSNWCYSRVSRISAGSFGFSSARLSDYFGLCLTTIGFRDYSTGVTNAGVNANRGLSRRSFVERSLLSTLPLSLPPDIMFLLCFAANRSVAGARETISLVQSLRVYQPVTIKWTIGSLAKQFVVHETLRAALPPARR